MGAVLDYREDRVFPWLLVVDENRLYILANFNLVLVAGLAFSQAWALKAVKWKTTEYAHPLRAQHRQREGLFAGEDQ